MSPALRNKIITVAAGGAMAITIAVLGGKDGIEGREYLPYYDVAGVLTVCDGHTGADIIKTKRYTDRECDTLLRKDLLPVKKVVDASVKQPMSEYRRAALYTFTYNVGTGAFTKSSLLKKLNAGDGQGACDELRRWIYAGGKKWAGLMNRRDMERELCLTDDK